MAVLVSTFVTAILEKMSYLFTDEVKGLQELRKEATKLEEALRNAQSVIEEAEEKQLEDRSIRLWLSEVKDVAYEADQIIDLFYLESLQRKQNIYSNMKSKVRQFFSYQHTARRINYDVSKSRREDLKNIVEMYNDSITVLPVEIGVRVSEAIAQTILESVNGNQFHTESLQDTLRQMLSSKRYIAVSVSDEDVTTWEQMKFMLSSFRTRGGGMPLIADTNSSEHEKYSVETSSFLVYSFAEIGVATNGFSESSMIGKGGYGSVYKGKLRETTVAIKMLDSHSRQSRREFFQELEVLCQMRHQNLVNLIGACFECYALVYEYLPNGSLEDCLRNRSGLLTWKIRTRIIFHICSSLKFLHSRSVVHGDIKPHNILLDASFNGKLADFGLCRFLPKGTTTVAFLETNPKGTLEYIDLKFLETGILRPSSDLYSFGVTILKLVTGQEPLGLSRRVSDAYENTFDFGEMIDATAGSWPFELAHELAYWGLQCCYNNEKSSQLMDDMWICLEEMLAEITELH